MATRSLEHAVLNQAGFPEQWRHEFDPTALRGLAVPRLTLLGLPCVRCRAYFAAALEACPICGGKDRVSSTKTRLRNSMEG